MANCGVNRIPCGAGLRVRHQSLFTQQEIYQSRFADVWPAHNGHLDNKFRLGFCLKRRGRILRDLFQERINEIAHTVPGHGADRENLSYS